MEYNDATALIVVDVQNDFASPRGSLYVPGGDEVIPFINAEIDRARRSGAHVVYTQDWHPDSTPHFEKDGGIWPVHCVAGTEGAEFHPDLRVIDDSLRIKKGVGGEDGYSGFHIRDPETGEVSSTGLSDRLREKGVETVVVLGLALDYCVKETAVDSSSEGFETTLLADGTSAVNLSAGDGARAVASMSDAGVTIE
ncbi:MAG: isochorismatase family protein [Actinobacteria bacterium]|nr:MAG: isochorismatase family protein [Actinomycetota bacterium]